jgi:hypothetical protein
VYGRVADYDAFRAYRLPLIYAGMAGARLGATGTVSFMGDTSGEFVTLSVDFLADRIEIREPDPQDLTAVAAKAGLWGNHGYEAAYVMTYVDDHGDQLVGENTYALRLSPPPPVGAFWSLTM